MSESLLQLEISTGGALKGCAFPQAVAPVLDMVRFVVPAFAPATLAALGVDVHLQQMLAAIDSPSRSVSRAIQLTLSKTAEPELANAGVPAANAAWLLGVCGLVYDEWIRSVTL